MIRRLDGWERIVILIGVIGGIVAGYFADRFYPFPEEPPLMSRWEISHRSEYETLNLLVYMLRSSEIDASLAKEKKRREAVCSTTSISLIERQLVCGHGVMRTGVLNWKDIENDLREKESFSASFEIGFRDEYGSTISQNQAAEKAKAIRPELSDRIDQFYSTRSEMLAKEISDRNESERHYMLKVLKYYSIIFLWIVIPGGCTYIFMACIRWVRSGFSQS